MYHSFLSKQSVRLLENTCTGAADSEGLQLHDAAQNGTGVVSYSALEQRP